ncbi:hypothetical protein [Klebsiella aerogenes]|uniref:hypothetical protein n=1 Tax=Klebsiella aerogenes TaxID=548 RepID=UPI000693436A|nr:hypothetical protein [Klebsiella aerogenes]
MNEPNYESIGRCVVLKRRINNKIDQLFRIKNSIVSASTPLLINDCLSLNNSTADCIEEAAKVYRRIMHEIEEMAEEHNRYAGAAGVGLIAIKNILSTSEGESNATTNT